MYFSREDENYVYTFVGKNIKNARKNKGWTQEQLAIKSTYSKQFISNIENNVYQTFSLGTLWRLSLILDTPLSKLCEEPVRESLK